MLFENNCIIHRSTGDDLTEVRSIIRGLCPNFSTKGERKFHINRPNVKVYAILAKTPRKLQGHFTSIV